MTKWQDVPVEVVEEAEEVKPEFEEALLFMPAERAEDFRGVVHVSVVSYPDKQGALHQYGTYAGR